MPRKREGTVKESLDELRELEERYRGKPEEVRITVLRLLKEDDERGIEDVAIQVGYSKPTVKRWWRTYREGGMDALLGLAVGSRRGIMANNDLNTLKQKLLAGEFNELADVREWIDAQSRKPISNGRLNSRHIIGNSSNKHRGPTGFGDVAEVKPFVGGHADLTRLFTFLSSIPSTHEITEWTNAFRSALRTFLVDVDRISISVNIRCDLLNPKGYHPDIVISQNVVASVKAVNPVVEGGPDNKNESVHLQRLLDNLRRTSFPFSRYHQPVCFVYYYHGHAYLGVIVLWRERSRPPISEHTLMLVERLNSFIGYILSDFAARYQAANPVDHVFDQALAGLTQETGLTMQERRIMVLQLLGMSYDGVATTLSISLNTVRYHLRSIYQKTGTHSLAELFAKYFTPRFDPNQASE